MTLCHTKRLTDHEILHEKKIFSNDGCYIIIISVNSYLVDVISSLGLKVSVVIFLEEAMLLVWSVSSHKQHTFIVKQLFWYFLHATDINLVC